MNNRRLLIINSLIVLGMFCLSLWAWQQIPNGQQIPVHYGLDSTPDRYGGKGEALLAMPLIGTGLSALFAMIPQVEPRAYNLMRSQKAYFRVSLATVLLLFLLHTAVILQAMGWPVEVATVVSVGVSLLLATVGNYLGKVRSNFSFGIRTPWTLSSEKSWSKTHRLGGKLLFGLGISGAIAALIAANQLFLLLILGGTVSITLFLVLYSYLVWRNDPERQSIEL
ncbi:MAG: SdpI family protein [Nodosilinea sp. WJT8-NPBG4]|jgi:uncharacterized membrane protein|nr:SdpI family protein [Nodosilinea sp. WJT8-NPBG4]